MKTLLNFGKAMSLFVAFACSFEGMYAMSPSAAVSDSAAQEIKVGTCAVGMTFNDATINDPAASNCDVPVRDGWVWFQATSTRTSICFYNTSNRDAAIYVYSHAMAELACQNGNGPNKGEVLIMTTVPGTHYHVRIAKVGHGNPALTGDIGIYNTPSNDDCSSATMMVVTSACELIPGTTLGASQSANAILCNGATGKSDDDVWYSFVAPASQKALISVKGASAGFNPVIDLRSTCNGASIACADASASNGDEMISATGLVAGQTYLVRVYGFDEMSSTSCGNFSICISDNCAQIVSYNVTGGGSYCSGGTGVPVGLSGSEATASYQLKLNGNNVGSPVAGSGSAISFGNQSSSGTYSVMATANGSPSCPVSMAGSANVSASSAPPAGYIGSVAASVANACPGTSFTATVQPVAGATEYVWSLTEGSMINGTMITAATPTVSSSSTTVNMVAGAPYGAGYYIFVYARNGCGRTFNTKATWVAGTLSTPVMASGNRTVCPSASAELSEKYSVMPVAGADDYLWTVTTTSGTAAIIQGGVNGTTLDLLIPEGFVSADICVVARFNCGLTSGSRCISISNVPSLPGSMSGSDKVCPGTSATYSIAKVSGAASYSWTLPAGANLVSTGMNATQDTAVVQFPAAFQSGLVSVTPISACDQPGTMRSKSVYANVPGVPASISGALTGACNVTLQYTTPSTLALADQFQWSLNNNIISGSSNTSSISFASGGTVCVRGINSACPAPNNMGQPRCITVSPRPDNIGAISGPSSVCPGGSYSFSVPAVSGMTFTWIIPDGCTITQNQGNSITVAWNRTSSGSVFVTGSNGCANSNTVSKSVSVSSCRLAAASESQVPTILAYPNPVEDVLTVQHVSDRASTCILRMLDMTGRTVMQEARTAQQGENQYELNLSHLAKGIYLLKAECGGQVVQTLKITVR